jgi:hypothetical protein
MAPKYFVGNMSKKIIIKYLKIGIIGILPIAISSYPASVCKYCIKQKNNL